MTPTQALSTTVQSLPSSRAKQVEIFKFKFQWPPENLNSLSVTSLQAASKARKGFSSILFSKSFSSILFFTSTP